MQRKWCVVVCGQHDGDTNQNTKQVTHDEVYVLFT